MQRGRTAGQDKHADGHHRSWRRVPESRRLHHKRPRVCATGSSEITHRRGLIRPGAPVPCRRGRTPAKGRLARTGNRDQEARMNRNISPTKTVLRPILSARPPNRSPRTGYPQSGRPDKSVPEHIKIRTPGNQGRATPVRNTTSLQKLPPAGQQPDTPCIASGRTGCTGSRSAAGASRLYAEPFWLLRGHSCLQSFASPASRSAIQVVGVFQSDMQTQHGLCSHVVAVRIRR